MPYQIRAAAVADVPLLATLHVQAFRETHGGGPSLSTRQAQWERIIGAATPADFAIVAETPERTLVGFARGCPHDGGVPGFAGELNKIYVLRAHHRQGLGRLLLLAVARRFLARGVRSMLLFGDAASPANGFYERMGAERLTSPEHGFNGGYGWRDIATLLPNEEL